MRLPDEYRREMTRRHFFARSSTGLGVAALASLLDPKLFASPDTGGLPGVPHFAPKATRVIFLHQSGGPSQMDLFDYKQKLVKLGGTELPESVRKGQRITGMTSGQGTLPVAPSMFKFSQHGQSGTWISELLPHTAGIVDDIAIVKSVHTDAINHDPAITFMHSGSEQPGRPSLGAWVSYGLGSENQNLPAFVVMISQTSGLNVDQPLFSRLWGSGFLSSKYQGVNFRSSGDPVLYLSDAPGIDRTTRRRMLDAVIKLNRKHSEAYGDPEIETRIAQYEMAFRMQTSVPEFMDLSKETEANLRAIRSRFQKAGNLRRPLPAGQAPGRTRRALRPALQERVGPAQRSPARSEPAVQERRSALGRLDSGPQAEGTARRDAGHMGRRIRPNRILPGEADRDQLRQGSSPGLLHDVDGGRRDQGRSQPGRNRRFLLQHCCRPGARS